MFGGFAVCCFIYLFIFLLLNKHEINKNQNEINHKTQNPSKHSHMSTSIPQYKSTCVYFFYKHQQEQAMTSIKKTHKFRSFQTQKNPTAIAMSFSISKTAI